MPRAKSAARTGDARSLLLPRRPQAATTARRPWPRARGPLGSFETELRARFLGIGLFDLGRTADEGLKLHSQIECLLRTLLRKRSAGTEEFRMVSPRRDSRIAQVKSLSLEEKPLAEMTEEELTERLRYFPFDRLMELASLQAEEQEQREIAELLAGLNGEA